MRSRIIVLCALLLTSYARVVIIADEIVGRVGAVDGQQIAIIISGEFEPQAGDRFTVVIAVPDIGEAVIAQGRVIKMDSNIAIGSIDTATGKFAEGQIVRVVSPQPIRRRRSELPQIMGQVGAVVGNEITIVTTSKAPVEVGDAVEVFAENPDQGSGSIGTGLVIALPNGLITARLETLTGTPVFGQQVAITSAKHRAPTESEVLGLKIEPVDAAVADLLDLPATSGLVVRSVASRSIGELAGIKKRDVLLRANGGTLLKVEEFATAVSKTGVVAVDVWREGASVVVDLAGGAETGPVPAAVVPSPNVASQPDSWLGIYVDNHQGHTRIRAVIPGSPTAKAGLRAGDHLDSIDGTKIISRDDAFRKFRAIPIGGRMRLEVIRDGTRVNAILIPEAKITDEKLFGLMNQLAETGDPIAAHEVGMMWRRGQGVPAKNPAEAIRWLQTAANGGHAQAQFQFGYMMIYAEGIEANPTAGANWVRRAAEQGDPDGVLLLAKLYQSGFGVERSEVQARRWFQTSVAQGTLAGMVEVARLHREGVLFERNDSRAAELFRGAAERDHVTGQREWGRCLRDGIGVERDVAKAVNWLRLAANGGDTLARTDLAAIGVPLDHDAQHSVPDATSITQETPSLFPEIPSGPPLVPTESDRQIIRAVVESLPREHFSSHPFDHEISDRTLQLFVEQLDPAKCHFNQEDISRFTSQSQRFAEQLKQGDLTLAFEIFRVFLERVRTNLKVEWELLNQPLDLTEEEWLVPQERFVANNDERSERQRKRTKMKLLTHRSAGASEGEAKRLAENAIRRQLEFLGKYNSGNVTEFLASAICDAFDPNTSFYPNLKLQDRVIELQGELVGVGLSLETRDEYTYVANIIPNGPAAIAGAFHIGDRIVSVGEGDDGMLVDVIGMPLNDVVAKIRGAKGSHVRLRVIQQGTIDSSVVKVQRDRVELSNFGSALLTGELFGARADCKIGYIYLPIFATTESSSEHGTFADVKRELQKFRNLGAEVIVLDVRHNSGGSLQTSLDVCGLFLGSNATITQVKDRVGTVRQFRATGAQIAWDGPVVVLTSHSTAGGAEILAAAIQDHQAGIVIGDEKTIGHGTVNSIVELYPPGNKGDKPVLGRLEVVMAKTYRATGDGLQQKGIRPDLVVPSIIPNPRGTIPQLSRFALPFDRIPSAPIAARRNRPEPSSIETLTQKSMSRRVDSDWFQRFEERSRASLRPTGISLQLETFLADNATNLALEEEVETIPGIPNVFLNSYLKEALMIASDYGDDRRR